MSKSSKKNVLNASNMGLNPPEIVAELDRFIVGQDQAKKAVAIALRNRYRRKNVPDNIRQEIIPKNILMIGPTGVGKTEVARRLAKLADSPFIKVEATKFTEVGYVGRDVDSIIRDLVEIAINQQRLKAQKEVEKQAMSKAVSRVLDTLVGKTSSDETKDKFRQRILKKELDNHEIEIQVLDNAPMNNGFEMPFSPSSGMGFLNLSDIISKAFSSGKTKNKKMTIKEALKVLLQEESDKLINNHKITSMALERVENDGIVFLDEVDKICSKSTSRGAEVSREGVQRDLLPLLEGTTVATKYGNVKTDYILFIASGAFQLSKPADLLPELQGRLPIRVELNPLTKKDLIKILTEPESSLIKQYQALIATEDLKLDFTKTAIDKIAQYAVHFNSEVEDIGARRLHTILEKLLEEVSYNAHQIKSKKITVDEEFVEKQLQNIIKSNDLGKFIL